LLGTLLPEQLASYWERRDAREGRAFRYLQQVLTSKRTLIKVKDAPPYTPEQEAAVYLDPSARAAFDPQLNQWKFTGMAPTGVGRAGPTGSDAQQGGGAAQDLRSERDSEALLSSIRTDSAFGIISSAKEALEQRVAELEMLVAASAAAERSDSTSPATLVAAKKAKAKKVKKAEPTRAKNQESVVKRNLEVTMREAAEDLLQYGDKGIGIDVEPTSTFKSASPQFIERNFTRGEQSYCYAAAHPAASFAGRWAAKEAVIKAISSTAQDTRGLWRGGSAPLLDIEVLPSQSGAPYVVLHGHAKQVATALGVSEVKVSISHAAEHAVAQAIAR
jgi:phosphopantetheine--protein transferase-like protein